MKKIEIAVFYYVDDFEDPLLLSRKTYNEYNYHNALKFLDYQFQDNQEIVIAVDEIE